MTAPNIDIVVARYKENLDWVKKVPSFFNVKIYNKYEGENLLPNVGRESHTYLHHIVKNYDNLPEFTVFVQGNPLEHSKDFFNLLNKKEILDSHNFYVGLSDGLITCDENGRPHCGKDHLPMGKLFEWIFNEPSPEVFICNSAGQFRVTRDLIRSVPKNIYERALLSVSYDINPIEGFCMERMWLTMFGHRDKRSRNHIVYENDVNYAKEEYFKICKSEYGDFIKLGELGPYAKF